VFLEITRILSGIQFARHFIEFVSVQTKQFISRKANVILTRQACSQHSSMATGSKRRALVFYFPLQNYHMISISKCRGEYKLFLCKLLEPAKAMSLCSGDLQLQKAFGIEFRRKSPLCSRIVFASPTAVLRPRLDYFLHIDIRNIQQIRMEK